MRYWTPAPGWSIQPAEGGLSLARDGLQAVLRVPDDTAREVLAAVSGSMDAGNLSAVGRMAVDQLDRRGAITAELADGQRVHARHEPGRRPARPESGWARPARALPATYLRTGPHGLLLAGSRSSGQLVLVSTWAVECAARLLAGADIEAEGDLAAKLLSLMNRAGLLVSDDPGDDTGDWEFHDAVFHSGSRLDTSLGLYGATTRPEATGQPVAVPRPSIRERLPLSSDEAAVRGVSLTDALLSRASVRDHGGAPIGRGELGTALAGALRVRRLDHRASGELAWRPVPTGGARSGLSAVIIVGSMSDLRRGAYEYDAVSHELAPAAGPAPAIDRWLVLAERLTGIASGSVQALILFTLDYVRPAQAYNSIVYATALKEVGAVLQALALMSVDLGLAFCPMGGGFATTEGLGDGIRPAAVIGEAVLGRPTRAPYGDLP